MNPWSPLVVGGLMLVAYLTCDLMYWVGYFDGKRSATTNQKGEGK